MTKIYEQHRAAFASVSAYVVVKDGERVATIAFKYPRDGAGRLYAYVHWLGLPMVRGFAGGGGYDKHSAACASAMRAMPAAARVEMVDNAAMFYGALRADNGYTWDRRLRNAGFEVWQAV